MEATKVNHENFLANYGPGQPSLLTDQMINTNLVEDIKYLLPLQVLSNFRSVVTEEK